MKTKQKDNINQSRTLLIKKVSQEIKEKIKDVDYTKINSIKISEFVASHNKNEILKEDNKYFSSFSENRGVGKLTFNLNKSHGKFDLFNRNEEKSGGNSLSFINNKNKNSFFVNKSSKNFEKEKNKTKDNENKDNRNKKQIFIPKLNLNNCEYKITININNTLDDLETSTNIGENSGFLSNKDLDFSNSSSLDNKSQKNSNKKTKDFDIAENSHKYLINLSKNLKFKEEHINIKRKVSSKSAFNNESKIILMNNCKEINTERPIELKNKNNNLNYKSLNPFLKSSPIGRILMNNTKRFSDYSSSNTSRNFDLIEINKEIVNKKSSKFKNNNYLDLCFNKSNIEVNDIEKKSEKSIGFKINLLSLNFSDIESKNLIYSDRDRIQRKTLDRKIQGI